MQKNIRRISFLFPVCAALATLFVAVDIYQDIVIRKSSLHIASDAVIAFILAASTLLSWRYVQGSAESPKSLPTAHLAIEEQLQKWQLTAAETTVALWIIRGLNFHQIADLLDKSERTVRQQAISVYAKSGLRNRSEFTGYFIESLHGLED